MARTLNAEDAGSVVRLFWTCEGLIQESIRLIDLGFTQVLEGAIGVAGLWSFLISSRRCRMHGLRPK